MPAPWTGTDRQLDLSPRYKTSVTVAGSPALAAETTIATLTVTEDLAVALGVELVAWCAFTVGTAGDGANLKIRQTGPSGTTIAATGLVTATAANLMTLSAHGL